LANSAPLIFAPSPRSLFAVSVTPFRASENRQIGIERNKFVAHFGRFESFVLPHGNAESNCFLFHRIEFAARRIERAVNRGDLFAFADEFSRTKGSNLLLTDLGRRKPPEFLPRNR